MRHPAWTMRHPGPIGVRLSATDAAPADWSRVADTWSAVGASGAFDAIWSNDHLLDVAQPSGGPALESMTAAAALAHRVPGMWVGIAVLSTTFRHPALVAKAATVLDLATGGRFILGMGAGWHEGEHRAFGIPLPPMRERFDRYEASVRVVAALLSDAARTPPGVTIDDAAFPLRGATNEPPPVHPGGPPMWLGGTRPRGLALIERHATGWPMPGVKAGDVALFSETRDRIRRALDAAGRDPDDFSYAAQLTCGTTPADLAAARALGSRFQRAGATHLMLGLPARSAPDGVAALARAVAEPLRGG